MTLTEYQKEMMMDDLKSVCHITVSEIRMFPEKEK